MAIQENKIAAYVIEPDLSVPVDILSGERTLFISQFTPLAPDLPEIVKHRTLEAVFGHYKPAVEVEFETEDGTMQKELLVFKGVGDFGIKGISTQSELLNKLTMKKEQYRKISRQLRMNKPLGKILSGNESKANLILALKSLIQQIDEADDLQN